LGVMIKRMEYLKKISSDWAGGFNSGRWQPEGLR